MKIETKDLGTESCPGDGVVKLEMFPHNRKPSHRHISGELLNFRGQPNQKHTHMHTHMHTHKHTHTHTHTEYLTPTTSGEVAQTLASTSSKWGLGREVQVAS